MAEIRKFNPNTGNGIQKIVREAIGETVRPVYPGVKTQPSETKSDEKENIEENKKEQYQKTESVPDWLLADNVMEFLIPKSSESE